jgi:SAM-dependent methyltransferase
MPYTGTDTLLARLRFRAAYPHIRPGSRVCDLGCGLETAFLDYASQRIAEGVGVDDQVQHGVRGRWKRVHADLCSPLPFVDAQFDHVVMLAVLEHLADPEPVFREAHRVLATQGTLILTWPSAMVDPILCILRGLHLVSNEMESNQHQRRIPVAKLEELLRQIGFRLVLHRRFQLGLNNLMVVAR